MQATKRLQIAKEFTKNYSKENPEVVGAMLVGSTNLSVTDKYADIDIIVIASPKAVAERKAAGKGYNETYIHKGIEICIDWHSLAEVEKEVANWKNDATLWSLNKAKILLDKKGVIQKLLENIKPYPEEIRKKKLFLHFYWLNAYLNIIEIAIKREEYETAAFHVSLSMKELAEILFLIENQFVPIDKWKFHEMKKLRLGRKLLPKIRALMHVTELSRKELEDKLALLKKMNQELKRYLVAAGVEKEKLGPEWWKFEPEWNVG